MKTVLFDIDGTLANIEHRRSFLNCTSPDWKRFNAEMGLDTPNQPIVSLYFTLWESFKYNIEIVTGRSEKFRKITEQWMVWNEIPFNKIHMRKDKDSRADYIIKKEILDELLELGYEIEFVVDDRQQVVDMWRENGIVCLQCDVGNF